MLEDAPQREYSLHEVFNGLRYVVRGGISWRMIPNDPPPWETVYQQTQRWLRASEFEAMVHDLRVLLRLIQGRQVHPSATILDSRTLHSSQESGQLAGYDGPKRRKGSKTHFDVDTLCNLLTLHVTAADEPDPAQVADLARQVQEVTGGSVEVAFVDHCYTRDAAAQTAAEYGLQLEVVKLPNTKRGFVLLPRHWVVEHSFGWMSRFRRLVRDYESLPETLKGLRYLAFAMIMLHRFVETRAFCI